MEERLIIAVAGFPIIYDVSLFAYRDINKKNEAWIKVSDIVGVPGELLMCNIVIYFLKISGNCMLTLSPEHAKAAAAAKYF